MVQKEKTFADYTGFSAMAQVFIIFVTALLAFIPTPISILGWILFGILYFVYLPFISLAALFITPWQENNLNVVFGGIVIGVVVYSPTIGLLICFYKKKRQQYLESQAALNTGQVKKSETDADPLTGNEPFLY